MCARTWAIARRKRAGNAAAARFGRRGNGTLSTNEQLVAALGHEPRLEALARAEHEDLGIRIASAQGVGDGEQRVDVTGGAAAGEEVRRHRRDSTGRGSGPPTSRSPRAPPRRRGALRRRGCALDRGAALGLRLGQRAREREQHPGRDEHRQQRRAALRHERQRHAEHGEDAQHDADVDERLTDDPHRDAARDDPHERVVGLADDVERADGEQREQREHDGAADEAELLADDREDVVVRGGGQPVVLLACELPRPRPKIPPPASPQMPCSG